MVQGKKRACMPVYIRKSGDLVGCYRCLTHRQTTEYRATQLGYSIKFKLSHAIKTEKTLGERGEEQYSGSLSLTNTVQDIKGTINNISIKCAIFKRHFLVPYD